MFEQSTLAKIHFKSNYFSPSMNMIVQLWNQVSYKPAVYYRDFDKHYVKNYGWHILKIEDLTSE